MKTFLSVGDILINPERIAYAVIETDTDGQQVRLGFGATSDDAGGELRLVGFEARSVIRWLRRNAEFLDSGVTASKHESVTTHASSGFGTGVAVGKPVLARSPHATRSSRRISTFSIAAES